VSAPTERDPARVRQILDAHLASLLPGQVLFATFPDAWARNLRVSRKQTYLWVIRAINDGRIIERRDQLYEIAGRRRFVPVPPKPPKPRPASKPKPLKTRDLRRAAIALEAFLAGLPAGAEFGEAQLLRAREGLGLGPAHVQAWLQDVVADARVVELKPSRYRKLPISKRPRPRLVTPSTLTKAPSPAQIDQVYGAYRQTLQSILDIYDRNNTEQPEVFLSGPASD
jgi:hypothetical protein